MSHEDHEYNLVLPFYIDTDGYTDRDREMFVCGFEFNSIYQSIQRKDDWHQPIHTENASRVRMMCGKLGVPVKLTPICETWTDCEIPASTTL